MIYAGIGNRKTPDPILERMKRIAVYLRDNDFILRSGHARGPDQAFESKCGSRKEIFLASDATEAAMALARRHHPAWEQCSHLARQLHGRNAMILLGRDLLTPVRFVVCWTPGGQIVGGTGLGIRIANSLAIPVFNLYWPDAAGALYEEIKQCLASSNTSSSPCS